MAAHLGMTVEDMLSRMSSRELSEWMAYFQFEPFGTDVEDLRSGILAATIVNVNAGKSSKTFKPEDFVPDRRKAILNPVAASLEGMMGKEYGKGKAEPEPDNRTRTM